VHRRSSPVQGENERELLVESTIIKHVTWTGTPVAGEARVQCSAHGPAHPATIAAGDGIVEVSWHEPQRRVAPGQSVVFYDVEDRIVLGGGMAR